MSASNRQVPSAITAIRERRSIRSYESREIPADVRESVIDAGRWAPSPHHSLPFRFAVLESVGARERLSTAMADQWRQDLLADQVPAETVEDEIAKSRRRIESAPLAILGCVYLDALDTYSDPERQQAEYTMAAHALGAALQNMMLAAHEQGLGAAWMCAPLFCPDTVRAAIGAPQAWLPQALLTMGYPRRAAAPGQRPPLADLILRA